jgi:hypothetical protein
MGLEACKTLVTAHQTPLTLPVSVASCEHFFGKMKLIRICGLQCQKADLRSLDNLSIQNEVTSSTDFSDVIKDFTAINSNEVQL